MARRFIPSIYTGHPSKRPAEATMLTLWLKSHGISKNKFAKMVGSSDRMMDLWCAGRVIPGLIFAFHIERASKGGVPVEAWLGIELGKFHWREVEKKITVHE